MRWRDFLSYKRCHLDRFHRYQLEVIFLFVFGFFLFFPYYILVEELMLDMQVWQWYFFFPWMGFYVVYSLWVRNRIPASERNRPLKRPIVHWLLLGIFWLCFFHIQPVDLEKSRAIDYAFAIFTFFLADSYWDFHERICRRFGRKRKR